MSSTTIEVAKYIHDLLYEYSSVIVPDLGAFSTRSKMANINDDSNTISPPTKTVVFNDRLKTNDGVLVGHISKMESIPPSLVEEALKKFAAETKSTLATGEAVSLGNLGTLQYQEGKGIEFYPTADLNLSLNSFGFETLDLPNVSATTPPSNSENIGAATIGGTSELDLPLDADKYLSEEEEKEATPSEKKTVSSVLAENAQNLPPVESYEERRREGGGWFWLLPLLILALCVLLIMQLTKDDDQERMADNNATQTEENSGLWSIPPFSWFAGDKDKTDEDGLADNLSSNNGNDNTDNSGNADNATNNQDEDENENNGNAGTGTDDGEIETIDTGSDNETGNNTTEDANSNSSSSNSSDEDANTDSNSNSTNEDSENSTDSNSNSGSNEDGNSASGNEDSNSNSDNSNSTSDTDTDSNTVSAENVTLTNTAALNGINVAKAKSGEYVKTNAPKGYYIIVGAFKSQSNANKAVSKLKSKGYEAHALQTNTGYYRVGIYGSTDGKTAKETYTKARDNENSKAWMLGY